jgi:hypothetical protein
MIILSLPECFQPLQKQPESVSNTLQRFHGRMSRMREQECYLHAERYRYRHTLQVAGLEFPKWYSSRWYIVHTSASRRDVVVWNSASERYSTAGISRQRMVTNCVARRSTGKWIVTHEMAMHRRTTTTENEWQQRTGIYRTCTMAGMTHL